MYGDSVGSVDGSLIIFPVLLTSGKLNAVVATGFKNDDVEKIELDYIVVIVVVCLDVFGNSTGRRILYIIIVVGTVARTCVYCCGGGASATNRET